MKPFTSTITTNHTLGILLQELNSPSKVSKRTEHTIQIDKDLLRRRMKLKWKDPGYASSEFDRVRPLKSKILNEWQIERINMSKRSYTAPKGHKGFKYDQYSRKFKDNSKTSNLYSKQFQAYLNKAKGQYQARQFNMTNRETFKTPAFLHNCERQRLKFHVSKEQLFGYSVPKLPSKLKTTKI